MSSQGPPSTSTVQLPDWLSQAGQGLVSAGSQVAGLPYQPYNGPRVADLSPLQSGAIDAYGQLGGMASQFGAPLASTMSGIIGGNANPFMDQVGNAVTRGVTDRYNNAVAQTSGRFNTPGNWGSARQGIADELNQRALSTGLGDALGQVYSSGYEQSQNRALQGIQSLPGLANMVEGGLNSAISAGELPRQVQQQDLSTLYNDFVEQRQYPWTQLQNFAGLLGSGGQGAGRTQTSTQGFDPLSQGLGTIALGNVLSKGKGGSGSGLGSFFG